ncbi:unnamed protein product [Callosobruchus maculatus]|uniref:Uncharacterized protein n=1 Tax=Callosobruchus maculatus TaxID=64391 RepID=A0A653CSK8_CALMS|nr:unnamed protein product [Callosobruchus maculatus]
MCTKELLLHLLLSTVLINGMAENIDMSKKGMSLNAFLQSKLNAIRDVIRIKNEAIRGHRNKKSTTIKTVSTTTEDQALAKLEAVLTGFLKAKANKSGNRGKRSNRGKGQKRIEKSNEKQKWDDWSRWSSCSVSCGKGRIIRWRHCIDSCDGIETEMQERACQLPACPHKLFGIIKL